MKSTHFVVFEKSVSKFILSCFGYRTRKCKDGVRIYKKSGGRATCHYCKTEMFVKDLGGVIPGKHLLCTNICCFIEYVVENKL